jgi:hypothetical protein
MQYELVEFVIVSGVADRCCCVVLVSKALLEYVVCSHNGSKACAK